MTLKPDKENGVVVMNRNASKFKAINNDPTLKVLQRRANYNAFQESLKKWVT